MNAYAYAVAAGLMMVLVHVLPGFPLTMGESLFYVTSIGVMIGLQELISEVRALRTSSCKCSASADEQKLKQS